jgi:hypothetical protein
MILHTLSVNRSRLYANPYSYRDDDNDISKSNAYADNRVELFPNVISMMTSFPLRK